MDRGRNTNDAGSLWVVGVGDVDDGVVAETAEAIDASLPFEVSTGAASVPISSINRDAYDDEADQYVASELAQGARETAATAPVLAVTDVDLTERRRNYVFGVGMVGGEAAVFSTYRLRDSDTGGAVPRTERIRKQAIKQAGRLLGMDVCDDRTCVLASAPTVRELDLTDESLCSDCEMTVRHRRWPPELEGAGGHPRDTADATSPAGSPDSDETAPSETSPRVADDSSGPPEDQRTGEYLLQSLHHDAANTVRFACALAGFGISFFVAMLLVVEGTEFLLGSWAAQSDQIAWLGIAISVGLAWYIYRKAKRLTSFIVRDGLSRIRATTDD